MFLGWLSITPLLSKFPSRKPVPPKQGACPHARTKHHLWSLKQPTWTRCLQHLLIGFFGLFFFILLQTAGSKPPASPAVKDGSANRACAHRCCGNLVWALGSHRESPSGGLTHLPAIPLAKNSFQDLQHYTLAGKRCSHNLGTTQKTLTGCAEGTSRVADILLQFRLWKFPGEHLPAPSHNDLRLDVGFSPLSLRCWQDTSALACSHIPIKKRPGHRFPMSGVLCHTYFKNSLLLRQFVKKVSEWVWVYLDCL